MKKPSRFSNSWKDVFTFSAGEKRGIYVLLILIFVLAGAIWFYRYYPPAFPRQDNAAFEKEVDQFLAAQSKQDSSETITAAEESQKKSFSSEKSSITYFDFDPNNLSAENGNNLG
jgi:hypothetical protein